MANPDPITAPKVVSKSTATDTSTLEGKQTLLVAYVASLAIVGAFLLTLILAFHYATAADTTSVLGVVIPIFSAVIGAVLGGGAGVVAGAAGKKSAQASLAATQSKVESAKAQMKELEDMVKKTFEQMQQNLSSAPGVPAFTLAPQLDSVHIAEFADLDNINSKMGHIKGLLE